MYNVKNRLREGMAMLFQKDIEPRCAYCKRGTPLDGEQVICIRRGIVSPTGSCRRFKYDPLKRVPPRPAKFSGGGLSGDDFKL